MLSTMGSVLVSILDITRSLLPPQGVKLSFTDHRLWLDCRQDAYSFVEPVVMSGVGYAVVRSRAVDGRVLVVGLGS